MLTPMGKKKKKKTKKKKTVANTLHLGKVYIRAYNIQY